MSCQRHYLALDHSQQHTKKKRPETGKTTHCYSFYLTDITQLQPDIGSLLISVCFYMTANEKCKYWKMFDKNRIF